MRLASVPRSIVSTDADGAAAHRAGYQLNYETGHSAQMRSPSYLQAVYSHLMRSMG
jgi:hypothetical protein